MKRLIFFLGFIIMPTQLLLSQGYRVLNPVSYPESDKNDTIYTVKGYRHGVSYFPQLMHSDVVYIKNDTLSFDKFHSNDVINEWMKFFAASYPGLTDLYQVAESYEGRPVLQMTITNKETGTDTDKPGAFFEGNRHSGEISSAETCLWMINYLLTAYGKDEKITRLVDTRAIYIRPVNNPDGHNLYIHTAQSNRSTVRPFDNDRDGLIDEDSPDDLDGDGIILSMRIKDTINGDYVVDPADKTGRIMKRVEKGQGNYRLSTEGIDNDGDGKINEDGIGGLDLHRNYPENWRPDSFAEATGRGYTQRGAGEYPLSEIETRSVVGFLLSHPNIYIVNSMDTRVPMHLRPPSTSASEERMYDEDREWYEYFDKLGKSITGYERAGDVYNDYGKGNPLFGHGPDFGYWYYGSIWYGDEIWNGGRYRDYDEDGDIDQIDLLRWDDEENNGRGFYEWKEISHPVYGKVETGGFHPKFFSQNPPSQHLLPWVRNQALFNVEMMTHLPRLEWDKIKIKKQKTYKNDSIDYQIEVSFMNTGKLPTALKQAQLVKIVKEDMVVLNLSENKQGKEKEFKILFENDERGNRRNYSSEDALSVSKNAGHTDGGEKSTVVFRIRLYKNARLKGQLSVSSTRGGLLGPRDVIIGGDIE